MRDSDWRITWNPAGETPRVLLDFGDPMDGEIQRDLVQVVDVGRFDQATQGRPFGRKNRKRRLEFNRLVEFDSSAEAFLAMIDAAMNDPWGEKSLIQIAPKFAGSIYGRAALLSFERDLVTQPKPGYTEKYAFRIDSGTTGPATGSPITIISGTFNPPIEGGGTASGGITVTVPPGHGLAEGDIVFVRGVNGVTPGYYPVSGVSGNNVTIDAGSNQTPAPEEWGDVTGGQNSGAVQAVYDAVIHASGMTNVTATYAWKYANESVGSLRTITPDSYGRATITTGGYIARIDYSNWLNGATPVLNPLLLDGTNKVGLVGQVVTEGFGPVLHVELWKNGSKIDEHVVRVKGRANKHYLAGSFSVNTVTTGKTVTLTLLADGGSTRLATGVSESIESGTVQKAE